MIHWPLPWWFEHYSAELFTLPSPNRFLLLHEGASSAGAGPQFDESPEMPSPSNCRRKTWSVQNAFRVHSVVYSYIACIRIRTPRPFAIYILSISLFVRLAVRRARTRLVEVYYE
ncbi:hypothetical protein EVAR_44844_1 [Eumeta japonica]|uniref:Uncharacterized protein n=1 Tax=Eumeta variegata TaxID=151549 RepID=A0A4C1YME2_EUMVA|nr:hypothetical protein EVAR_44844_1 [Eumeta japonica]